MRRMLLLVSAVSGLGLAAGCEPNYVYRPTENVTARLGPHAAARYEVPPERPEGDVRIASFGIAKVTPRGTAATPGERRAMHVRMVASNTGNAPWTVDLREQEAIFRGGLREAPAWASSDVGGFPLVTVPPGAVRTIDLFFPLPPGAEKAKRIPEFDVLWRVRTPERVVAERTPFERMRIEPLYAGYGPSFYGWGPYGWYDPFWGPAFVGPPGWYW